MHFIRPQLLGSAPAIPHGGGWIFERKYDGLRGHVAVEDGHVQIFTRGGHDWTDRFSSLVPSFARLGRSAYFDGEICATGGLDDRTDLSGFYRDLADGRPLSFFAFDLLALDGKDLTGRPLVERKALLAELLASRQADRQLHGVPSVACDGTRFFEEMTALGHEGIVAKRQDARYFAGERSRTWLKFKASQSRDFAVVGWCPNANDRSVNSLVLAEQEDGHLRYRGRVGTGFSHQTRRELWRSLTEIEVAACPLTPRPAELNRATKWVAPGLAVTVSYQDVSRRGILRSPVFHSQSCSSTPPALSATRELRKL